MKFSDFKDNPQDLLGKLVLVEQGDSYSKARSLTISSITKVTKTGFRIAEDNDSLYSLNDGWKKGLHSKWDMAVINRCELITEEQATKYRERWAIMAEIKALRTSITDSIALLTIEQLRQVQNIINQKN